MIFLALSEAAGGIMMSVKWDRQRWPNRLQRNKTSNRLFLGETIFLLAGLLSVSCAPVSEGTNACNEAKAEQGNQTKPSKNKTQAKRNTTQNTTNTKGSEFLPGSEFHRVKHATAGPKYRP